MVNRPAALTIRAAAAVLGTSEWTVRRAIASGELTAMKIAGAYRITPSALAVYRRRLADTPTHGELNGGPAPEPLPGYLTPFFGRDRERAEIRERFVAHGARLLTLTGPGGVGKTRLALEIAGEVQRTTGCEVRLVPLDTVSRPEFVLPAIAQAVGLHIAGNRPLLDALAQTFGDRKLLLVLDNVEHVVAAAPAIATLLVRCPQLRILTTSRVRLQIDGEQEYPVPSLGYPDPATIDRVTIDDVVSYPAVALFVARARAVDPGFTLTEDTLEAVVGICARLDGLPLAIELAAARTKVLPPGRLLDQLDRSLPLLTGGSVDRPARHQTLRDTVAWSHDLLASEDQALFRRLAVCVGGFTLELATAIASRVASLDPGTATLTTLDGLQRLVDHSLVRAEAAGEGHRRFVMLETIREYALEQLDASGEAEAVRDAHAAAMLQLAEQHVRRQHEPLDARLLRWHEAERENVHAALAWLGKRDPARYVQLVGTVSWAWWWVHGYRERERVWLERAVALGDAGPPLARAEIRSDLGYMLLLLNDVARAERLLAEGLALFRALDDVPGIVRMLMGLGLIAGYRGDQGRSVALLEEGLAHARAIAEPRLALIGEGAILRYHGLVAYEQGRLQEAEADLARALDLERQAQFTHSAMHSLAHLGDVARLRGDRDRASACYRESLQLCWRYGESRVTIWLLEGIAAIASADGDTMATARLFGAAVQRTGGARPLYPCTARPPTWMSCVVPRRPPAWPWVRRRSPAPGRRGRR